jgi:hypothetical protein
MFAYTFNIPGVYVFHDYSDKSQKTIISVVSGECSNKDNNINPQTLNSMLSSGVVSRTASEEPDWNFVMALFLFIFLIVFGFVSFFSYLYLKGGAEDSISSGKEDIYESKLKNKTDNCLTRCFTKISQKLGIDEESRRKKRKAIKYEELKKI